MPRSRRAREPRSGRQHRFTDRRYSRTIQSNFGEPVGVHVPKGRLSRARRTLDQHVSVAGEYFGDVDRPLRLRARVTVLFERVA